MVDCVSESQDVSEKMEKKMEEIEKLVVPVVNQHTTAVAVLREKIKGLEEKIDFLAKNFEEATEAAKKSEKMLQEFVEEKKKKLEQKKRVKELFGSASSAASLFPQTPKQ